MIALEVDGPHHFTANTLKPLGEMLARQRLLEARGWTVISVPFYIWSNRTTEYKHSCLQEVDCSYKYKNAHLLDPNLTLLAGHCLPGMPYRRIYGYKAKHESQHQLSSSLRYLAIHDCALIFMEVLGSAEAYRCQKYEAWGGRAADSSKQRDAVQQLDLPLQ